jgi:tRNA pseudouridine55 synthase
MKHAIRLEIAPHMTQSRPPKKPLNAINGWIILDKPSGITSAHAVGKVKRLLRPAKIGHAGTLDPLASGILPLALGEATKTVSFMMDASKAYSFEVTWGQERDSDDIMGEITHTSDKRPSQNDINTILHEFIGDIQQQPPSYSAIKVDGKRAYDLARQGQAVSLKSRIITVHSLEMTHYSPEKSSFICHCGKGTYIRSLARDMGRKTGALGHISVLRRLKVGNFTENHAISLEVLEEMGHKDDPGFLNPDFLLPVESALDDIPAMEVDSTQATLLKRGQAITLPSTVSITDENISKQWLVRSDGKAIAMCTIAQGKVKPVRVFNLP